MKAFDWRGFVSIFLFLDFLVLAVSGIALYVAPSGRVAREIDFTFLGLDKEQWELVHDVFGYAMIVAIPFHMYFNWKIFVYYFMKVVQKAKRIRVREAVSALTLSVFLFVTSVYSIFPASIVSDLSEKAKEYWEVKSGIVVEHEYESSTESVNTDEHEESTYRGYGWKTVKAVADELGIDVQKALENLKNAGISADENTTIRQIMDETGMTSADVVELMRGGDE